MKFLSYEGLQYLYSKILTRFNLKVDKSNGDISDTKINSVDTIATSFPIPNAGENTKTFMGKVKKALTDWSDFKNGIVTLGMLTNQHINSADKIPTAALLYPLKGTVDSLDSNLGHEYDIVTGTFSVPTDYLMSICNIWLPPGVYIINTNIRLTLTTTARVDRYLKIGDNTDGRGSGSLVLGPGFQSFAHSCVITVTESSKSIVLQARHFNGTSLSVEGWMFVTRLK